MTFRIPVLCAAIVLATAAPASARDLVTIDAPSVNVNEATANYNADNTDRRLRANVLLPEGYDADRDYPVLFLLHGAGDAYTSWALPEKGAIAETAEDLDAIIVMPEGATAFYTDWFNGGRRGDPAWETYYLEELIPLVERRFSVRTGRRWHAIAGLSMGGFGATDLASRLPGYFGNVGAFSGALDIQDPGVVGLFSSQDPSYEDYWGAPDGAYATGHNPARLTDNLRASRVYVTTGDGTPEPGQPASPGALTAGAALEAGVKRLSDTYVAAARASGVDVTYSPEHGVHDWPYWRRDVHELMAWGPFAEVPEAPEAWTYETVATRGDMWGLHFAFSAPPDAVATFRRQGAQLAGDGAGEVTVVNARGCGFTARLPFDRALPPAACAASLGVPGQRMRVSVRPRAVPRGRSVRLRVRVTVRRGGRVTPVRRALVKVGGTRARTGRSGRAVLRRTFAGRPGTRTVFSTRPGLAKAKGRVRVLAARR